MNYIIDKEQYLKLKAAWKKQETHSSSEIVAYNILRGFDAKRGFTEKTNKIKLANGATPWQAFESARNGLNYYLKYSREKTYFKKWDLDNSEELTTKMLEALK